MRTIKNMDDIAYEESFETDVDEGVDEQELTMAVFEGDPTLYVEMFRSFFNQKLTIMMSCIDDDTPKKLRRLADAIEKQLEHSK